MAGGGGCKSFSLPSSSNYPAVIPSVGLGCWQISDDEAGPALGWAVEAGARLVDSAFMYGNEEGVGRAIGGCIESGKVGREELFVVTKLPMFAMQPRDVLPFFEKSRKALGLDYVDLYLIHSPVGVRRDEERDEMKLNNGKVMFDTDTDHIALWREMEKLCRSGRCRSIGVSNFNSDQLERLAEAADIPVAVNQIECNAYFQQRRLRGTMEKLGIRAMAYAPLGSPNREIPPGLPLPQPVLQDKVVGEIAEERDKTTAQVLIRHLIQQGVVAIPKSVREERIMGNFDVFGFSLSEEEMQKLDSLDKGSGARTFTLESEGDFLPVEESADLTALAEYPVAERDNY